MALAGVCCARSALTRDSALLFATRTIRMFSFGGLTVVLLLYLSELGFSDTMIGVCLAAILLGDLGITFALTTWADRLGRKRTLLVGAALKLSAGIVFALSGNVYVLIAAGIFGVITPNGNEIGPFLAVEQAALTDVLGDADAGTVATFLSWYQFFGMMAVAGGAVGAGHVVVLLEAAGWSRLHAFRFIVAAYAAFAGILLLVYPFLTQAAEPRRTLGKALPKYCNKQLGLSTPHSLRFVLKAGALFALDAFAGGFIMQTFIVLWFNRRWDLAPNWLGLVLMGMNMIGATTALAVGPLVRRFGAVNVMVFSHLPSNLLLVLVPLMPTGLTSMLMLWLRCTISQMDVPARQTFVMMGVTSEEKSAANGLTNLARSLGLLFAPIPLGYMVQATPGPGVFSLPWYLCGAIKIVYDLIIYLVFVLQSTSGAAPPAERLTDEADPMEEMDANPRRP